MEILFGIDQIKKPFVNPVVTLGNFDGVHLGHQRIFERLKIEASKIQGEALVITFEPHPLKILSPNHCPPLITPFKKKMLLIEAMGIKKVICIEFSLVFAEISPLEFVRDYLAEKVNTKKVIIGYNYHFGKGKSGNAEILKKICKHFNIAVEVMEALTIDHIIVSSSKIRELIQEGNVEKASKLLGRDYPIIGKVIEGAKRGNTLGFPTANLEISEELYPKTGVYAVEVLWKNKVFKGVANVGYNPTFHSKIFSLEVHILSFNQEIYGDEIQVNFKRRIRDEIRFDSPSHLIDQIQKDILWAEENIFK
jgi:riboflavin kinase/FMN adenylyltransferase